MKAIQRLCRSCRIHSSVRKNNPRNMIHFILQFDSKQNDAFTLDHMTNNAIFLIESVRERIKNNELLEQLGCKMAFKGVITNKRQFTQLDGTTSAEDPRQLYDRTSAMENQNMNTNTETKEEVQSPESE